MQRARSIRLLSSAGLLVLLAMPAFAGDGAVKAKFDAAETAYDLGDFDKARNLYAEAYELKPLPGFLFNIGQCHKRLGEWNRAAFYYRRYLARLPEDADPSKLEALIAEMDAKALAPAPREPERARPSSPKLVPAVAVTARPSPPGLTAPPMVIRESGTPAHAQWWVWAGAGALTVATVATVVAVGVVSSQRGAPPPKYGKLDAR